MKLTTPLTVASLVSLAAPALAQSRFAVTESYDPASFIEPGVTAADVLVVNSSIFGGGAIQWEFAEMGLPGFANIDAFSDGTDIFPATGPSISPPPANCSLGGFIEAQFTLVDPMSEGPAGGEIEDEAMTDGAASDTFAARWDNGSAIATFRLESDALGVSPLPMQTDLERAGLARAPTLPGVLLGRPCHGRAPGHGPRVDLHVGGGTGSAPTELFSSSLLGLGPGGRHQRTRRPCVCGPASVALRSRGLFALAHLAKGARRGIPRRGHAGRTDRVDGWWR